MTHTALTHTVERDWNGTLYVEYEGRQYESADLPPVGTWVSVDAYTGDNDCRYLEVRWTADTPAGESYALAQEM